MKKLLAGLGAAAFLLVVPFITLAADAATTTTTTTAPTTYNLSTMSAATGSVATGAGLSAVSDLPTIIGRIISVILGLLGILFLVLVVYAGFLYLTAQGVEENTKKAKKILSQAVTGIVIIVAAYAITKVVTDALSKISA